MPAETTVLPYDIGEELRTQDNACTNLPIFAVQQRVRDYGLEEASQWEWRNAEDDWDLASPEEAARLDEVMEAWDDPAPWVRNYYEDRWEFVTACLTRKGCEEYLRKNDHNLTEPRIYAYSAYRNVEWSWLRETLAGQPAETEGPPCTDARTWDPVRDAILRRLQEVDQAALAKYPSTLADLADQLTTIALGEREQPEGGSS
ncbi:hypothetical protein [Gaopeijia maritima]|uniref:hypothetical protein n=1 Tax=Gaopeijia maritima TaxID=3119007 RepID=UPI003278F564